MPNCLWPCSVLRLLSTKKRKKPNKQTAKGHYVLQAKKSIFYQPSKNNWEDKTEGAGSEFLCPFAPGTFFLPRSVVSAEGNEKALLAG